MRSRLIAKMALACLLCIGTASADDLVLGGTVTKVSNISSNQQNFSIVVIGGSLNVCAPNGIAFPASVAPDLEAHKRAYAIALLALTTGLPVRVHNYQGSTCTASFIEVSVS